MTCIEPLSGGFPPEEIDAGEKSESATRNVFDGPRDSDPDGDPGFRRVRRGLVYKFLTEPREPSRLDRLAELAGQLTPKEAPIPIRCPLRFSSPSINVGVRPSVENERSVRDAARGGASSSLRERPCHGEVNSPLSAVTRLSGTGRGVVTFLQQAPDGLADLLRARTLELVAHYAVLVDDPRRRQRPGGQVGLHHFI